jgi:Zn-dependent M28 family amino/carboxypeptidase
MAAKMKIRSFTSLILIIISGMIFFYGCSKEKDPLNDSPVFRMVNEINADSLKAFVKWMEGMGTRFSLADNHRQVAVKLKDKFISFGYPDVKLDSFRISRTYNGTVYNQWQYNVIAKLEGTINPDSLCIIGGHYDNILRTGTGDPFTTAYGANDNASGTAAALEVARVLQKNSFESRNTILFIAFGAEELGLFGSKAYADTAYKYNAKIKMMLNNDMIAYEPSSVKTDWIVNILDYDNSHDLRYKAEDLLQKFTVLNNTNINTYNKQSDSYPFSLKGYPAIFFISNASDPNYHTPNDVSGQCNFYYCAEVVKISCALLVDANTSD